MSPLPNVSPALRPTFAAESHGQNMSVSSFAVDDVFSDRTECQLAPVTGDVTNGYVASRTGGIARDDQVA